MNRRRDNRNHQARRGAAMSAGVGIAAALAAGALTAPSANALVPTRTAISAGCMAGDLEVADASRTSFPRINGPTADCTQARPALITRLADGVIGIFVDDLDLQALNGAAAFAPNSTAVIKGRGHTLAVGGGVGSSGHATAHALDYLSAAIAAGGMGSTANAFALMGVAAAAGVFGGDADASAWPGGIALAVSANGAKASARALGGIAMASSAADRVVCTAVFATATVSGGSNSSTCTSLLFLFERYQVGDGPVSYAIKNPLSFGLVSPVSGDADLSAVRSLLDALGAGSVLDVATAGLIPAFRSDLIRLELHDDGVRLRTDLVEWVRGLFTPSPTPVDVATLLGNLGDAIGEIPEALGKAAEFVPEPPAEEESTVDIASSAPAARSAPSITTGGEPVAGPVSPAQVVDEPVDGPASSIPAEDGFDADGPVADTSPDKVVESDSTDGVVENDPGLAELTG